MFDAAVQDPGKPYWIVFTVDYAVFGYVAAICVLTAIRLRPRAGAARLEDEHQRRAEGRRARQRRQPARATGSAARMVVVELALTIVLLAGAGLMIRSFMKLYTLDIGDPHRVI